MMSFADIERRVSRAAMKHLSNTDAVFWPPGENSITVERAHFTEPYQDVSGGEVMVESTAPTLAVLEEDMPVPPQHDWEVEARGRWFLCVNPKPDGTGMIIIQLQEIEEP